MVIYELKIKKKKGVDNAETFLNNEKKRLDKIKKEKNKGGNNA